MTAGSRRISRKRLLQRGLPDDDLPVFEERLVGRIDDDDAVEPVQQGVLAGLQLLR